MWHVTWKNLVARKLRLVTTSLAIALGVAFVAGALMLGATIAKTFDDLFANVYKSTDAVVRGPKTIGDNGQDLRSPIDESLVQRVRSITGVRKAEPYVQGFAQLENKDGKPLTTGGAPQFGAVWTGSDSGLNPFTIIDGKPPSGPDDVVIDNGAAKKGKLKAGDVTTVLTQQPPHQFHIAAVAKFGQVDSPGGAQFVMFRDIHVAQRYLGQPGKVDSISIVAAPGLSQEQLVNRLKYQLPTDVDVITGKTALEENQSQLKKSLSFVTIFLEIFAGVALFVGAFIINNTFSILVAQRTRETALLRAVGASRRQVLVSVMFEAFIVGLIASILGLALGVLVSLGLKALLAQFGAVLPTAGVVIPASAVIVSLVAGTVITVIAAVLPARRSSKVPPIAALRDVAIDETGKSIARAITGALITAVGVVLIAIGLTAHIKRAYVPVGLGAALTFIGVAVLGPVIAKPVSRILGAPLPKIKGETGVLARENAMRNPKRTSATAAALMIGVAAVTLATVFFSSLKASTNRAVDRSFKGDFILQESPPREQGGISPELARQLRQRSEFSAVAEERFANGVVDGKSTSLAAITPKEFAAIADLHVQQGRLETLNGNELAISQKLADDRHWSLGQTVPVQLAQGGPQDFKISVIYKDTATVGDYAIPVTTYSSIVPQQQFDLFIYVNKSKEVSDQRARDVANQLAASYATIKVQDQTEFKKEFSKRIDSALNIFYALLGLTIIIALMGIANTLALSVFERTREIGLLRAVGMTRRQVRSMVRWESVIVALLGTGLGLIIGVAFGWAVVNATKSNGIDVLSVPVGTVIAIVVIAAIAGVLAAILPARRAANLNVLAAIATE